MSGWGDRGLEQLRSVERQIADARVRAADPALEQAERDRLRSLVRNLQRERRGLRDGLGISPAVRRNG